MNDGQTPSIDPAWPAGFFFWIRNLRSGKMSLLAKKVIEITAGMVI
jgi:hypothetical protein